MAAKIAAYVSTLSSTNFLYQLYSLGVIEIPTTVTILLFFFWIFNTRLWRYSLIRKMFGIPDLNGRYVGNLTSSYSDEAKEDVKYPVAIEIIQTLTSIKVLLYRPEGKSYSYSIIANLCRNNKNNYELVYVYQSNTHTVKTDTDMRDHQGSAFLESSEDGKILSGYYFTNPRERSRYGVIEVKKAGNNLKNKY